MSTRQPAWKRRRRRRRLNQEEEKARLEAEDQKDEEPEPSTRPASKATESVVPATESEAQSSVEPMAARIDPDEVVDAGDKILDQDRLETITQSGARTQIGADLSERLDAVSPDVETESGLDMSAPTPGSDRWSQTPGPEQTDPTQPEGMPQGGEPEQPSGPGGDLISALGAEALGAELGLGDVDPVGVRAFTDDAEHPDVPAPATSGAAGLEEGPDPQEISQEPAVPVDRRVAAWWDFLVPKPSDPEDPDQDAKHPPRGYDPDQPFDYVQGIPEGLTEIGEVAGSSGTDPAPPLPVDDAQRDEGQTVARLAAEDAMMSPLDPYIDPAGEEEGELPPGAVLPEPEEPDPAPPLPVDDADLDEEA